MLTQYRETILCKRRHANRWKRSKVAEKVSLMKTAWALQPLHEWLRVLNELMLWFKRTDGFTVTDTADKLDISCGSAYFVIHEDL
jgi:hypothetical protein